MSKQRQRDRAAREAAAAELAAQQAEEESRTSRRPLINAEGPVVSAKGKRGQSGVAHQGSGVRPAAGKAPTPARKASAGSTRASRPVVYRSRRFPPLPWRLKLALALGWSIAVVLALFLVPTWTGRLGFVVVATFALPLIVVLVHDPSRRTR